MLFKISLGKRCILSSKLSKTILVINSILSQFVFARFSKIYLLPIEFGCSINILSFSESFNPNKTQSPNLYDDIIYMI